ncbi:potassium transporter Kup [Curtobacterium sp. MCPF17_052]|uniref:potassium transporter Kup n=1 Tax=Curtobacterium sp. MCPF17_052 TaxID=2175655 RepID=UPI0024DF7BBD|nr:KUP/HAK/KT family potassium transporter [Curtobacterium sp. MCPF17_052]WIB11796.1 KUP/HAK/KT family potassium transporter [Curtobacterium sp. MCPF17_052]
MTETRASSQSSDRPSGGRDAQPGDAGPGDDATHPAKAAQHPAGREARGHRGKAGLALAALGVVFGDIGTSPLYSMRTVFSVDGGIVRPVPEDVYGVISLLFWSITIIVSIKYVLVLMRVDNHGEGGVMALAALARRLHAHRPGGTTVFLVIGIVGVALFYGDSVITPAVSVLSAVEGLGTAAPSVEHLIVPIAAVILVGLFIVQKFGTAKVGASFGPVMLLWFIVIAVAGIPRIVEHPGVLQGLSPTWAIAFLFAHPFITFIAMGAVVLAITGAEALYADMGHFGRMPILRAWFFVVFPALVCNYLGQAALVLEDPTATKDPFFLLFPNWAQLPVVILATAATVIASQAVISGAFSLTRQAVQLGLLPPLTIRQTSKREGGQVYLPAVNLLLFIGVMAIMLAFRSSAALATAYGVSVTGALVVDTLLLLVVVKPLWRWATWKLVTVAVVFGGLELTFLAGNLSKVLHGGWVPLLIALAVITLMTTWHRGRQLVQIERRKREGSLAEFIETVNADHIPRVPGIAVFPHPNKETTPLALRANVEHNGVVHQRVIIVSVLTANVPHVALEEAFRRDELGYDDDGIDHITITFGFSDDQDLPAAMRAACAGGCARPGAGGHVHGVVLHLTRSTPDRRGQGRHGVMAAEAVRRDGAQRCRPGGALRAAARPHGDDGQRRRGLSRGGQPSRRSAAPGTTSCHGPPPRTRVRDRR